MSANNLFHKIKEAIRGAGSIVKESLRMLLRYPHILIYPYLAVIFILITSPFISSVVISLWRKVEQPIDLTNVSSGASHTWLAHLGLVSFSVFYTIFVSAFFVCAISAATIASLERQGNNDWFYGLRVVWRNFFRITKFALLAIFFLPLGIIAQRHKFKTARGSVEAITSSFSLSMAQLAPAVIKGEDDVFHTIRHSIDTLGHFWKESVVIRAVTIVGVIVLGSISFLPKLIQHTWFNNSTGHLFGWIITALLGVSSFVVLHVISTVFMTNLYMRAEKEKRRVAK